MVGGEGAVGDYVAVYVEDSVGDEGAVGNDAGEAMAGDEMG